MRTCLLVLFVGVTAACRQADPAPAPVPIDRLAVRTQLEAELRPVKLTNCEFARVGDAHDGGYVICQNLLPGAQAIYSYGISASDQWGCALSSRMALPVHQYDCFNTTRPACGGASPVFHEECVGPARETREGRLFDTIEAQMTRNGDAGKRVVMKMDVEGSEWQSFLAPPDSVLASIDQLSVEFHGVEEPEYVEAIKRLKQHFYVVNVHYNNWTCHPDVRPLMALAYEVLFVNKRIGVADPAGVPQVPNPLDAPNNWERAACQAPAATESKSPR